MLLIWLIAFAVFLVVEEVTISLTGIWFAGDSLTALIVQMCGGGPYPQLAVFMAVSFMLLPMVHPFAYKYLYGERTEANVDSLTGHRVVVKDHIDNMAGTGIAILAGETRPARTARKGDTFEAGDAMVIFAVNETKLLVAATKQEHGVEEA